ncbi:MAG: EscU/YscU/HrcU family type III secretion system export apparatus switch protein [Polyangiaceae bacterium]|nr:EscU/YscU/HrcU family type III secretion system export apparatus switch protein [Polyangiaceae bacterium]
MSEAGAGDRKYDPTPNRREKFLKDGRFPKARDAGGVAATAATLGALYSMGDSLIEYARHLFRASLGDLGALSRGEGGDALRAAVTPWGGVVLPVALGAAIAATLVGFAQAGVAFRPEHIGFKIERVNPFGRLQQLFSPKNLATEGPLALVRVTLVGYVAYLGLEAEAPALERLGGLDPVAGFSLAARSIAAIALRAAAALVGLAIIDYTISKFKLEREMKMTLQELKEESRSEEGDPKVKGRIRARARALARKRMMNDVKKADVVVVNPTHVSVALRYGAGDAAPMVLAKGVDEIALAIRTEARKRGIPIVESRALARALEAEVKVGHPVPSAHYAAVAQVLAFVFRLRGRKAPSLTPPSREP